MRGMIRAAGLRIGWAELPADVRGRVESLIGGQVLRADSQLGGFSPGTADRVVTSTGRRAFVKAVSVSLNETSAAMARQEARVTEQMPAGAPVPRLLEWFDDGEWVVLIVEDVAGRHPRTPWVDADIDAAVSALDQVAVALRPAVMRTVPEVSGRLAAQFAGWSQIAADPMADLDGWATANVTDLVAAAHRGLEALRIGGTVAHCDIRADNLLVRPDGTVVVVDWPWASVAPAWLDTVLLAMDVVVHGGDGDRILRGVDLGNAVDVCAGFAGYLMHRSRQPSPGIPYVREFQRAQADRLLPWIKERMN
ncbi:phosphotransferase family protein [Actinoplanes sp. N902-109]|uniref:phosphotransferase family protein n=1 Tax=Actinoplanes sp. (strain N902-109) TaxID=649831 RepID=UPI0003294050|nr:phosphotransferase [Actinoplanes sp. N902-109]AGL14920.1 aminoglycoside phosphotransferase [Actinoplanes sp. N902-109]